MVETPVSEGTFAGWLKALNVAPLGTFAQYQALCEALWEANQRLNLTRIPRDQYLLLHVLDSLSVMRVCGDLAGKVVLDLGTGGGFPGLPLAIAFPKATFVLLDATRKKLDAVAAMASSLGICNVRVVHARAEECARLPEHRARYDVVVSRAVTALQGLVGLMLPFANSGGIAVAMKGAGVDSELSAAVTAIARASAEVLSVDRFLLPAADAQRALVVLRRT